MTYNPYDDTRIYLGTHTHALLIVTNAAALNADLDTALRDWLIDAGLVVTVCDPADVGPGDLEISAFDLIVVSASCDAADAANLVTLREVEVPIICHSAAIAVSAALNLGATAGTEAAQTAIDITNNTPMWLIDQGTGDLVVTASTTIYKMETKAANAVKIAETAVAAANAHLTIVKLPQGLEDDGTPSYAPFFDRYFVGVADYTNMNAAWKAIMEELIMHCVMEKRFSGEVVVVPKRVYQEDIPDTGFSISPDDTLTSPPPSADPANSVVDIDALHNRTFVLRGLWVNITNLGTGTNTMTFKLWIDVGGTAIQVDNVDVTSTGYQNLMDLFGLPEVHADGIWITAQVNDGTGACAGIYRYAEAKK